MYISFCRLMVLRRLWREMVLSLNPSSEVILQVALTRRAVYITFANIDVLMCKNEIAVLATA